MKRVSPSKELIFKEWVRRLSRKIGVDPINEWPFLRRFYRYHAGRPPAALGSDLLAPMALRPRQHVPSGSLFSAWRKLPGGHKWHHYFEIYENVLAPFVGRPVKMLEMGVYRGGSLRMWSEYLHKDSVIVGVDIDSSAKVFDHMEKNIHVRIGDQSNAEFLDCVMSEFGKFDVILDDGSHKAKDMICSFRNLFIRGLKPGGVYIVEDIHTNYWETPYISKTLSFVEVVKSMIDLMHYHYIARNELHFRLDGSRQISEMEVPRIGAEIAEIRFFDSMVVLRRSEEPGLPVSEHR